jgi:hypothetical protein
VNPRPTNFSQAADLSGGAGSVYQYLTNPVSYKSIVAYEVWWDASISKNPVVDVSECIVFDLSSFWSRNVTFESEREHYFTLA